MRGLKRDSDLPFSSCRTALTRAVTDSVFRFLVATSNLTSVKMASKISSRSLESLRQRLASSFLMPQQFDQAVSGFAP